MKKLQKLRNKHPVFIYDNFDIKKSHNSTLVRFVFKVEPNITFTSKITFNSGFSFKNMDTFVFNLGLIEAISYWKATCSPRFLVKAGSLTSYQKRWWKDLFFCGLGEFYYKNRIDFSVNDFLTIDSLGDTVFEPQRLTGIDGDLILASGGSDSVVTLELLKNLNSRKRVLLLDPTKAALSVVATAGYKDPLIVRREIDPKLLELNSQGYLNGHTPFSAYLAFLGVLVAAGSEFPNVIVSNEKSADEVNVRYHGVNINHQYSKSSRFEALFRAYSVTYLSPQINYFSMLRPIYKIQSTEIFSRYPKYFKIFRSCNAGQEKNIWCANCAKCAFSYLILSPFIPHEQMIKIFGSDYFSNQNLKQYFADLVKQDNKPFDCVGTTAESKLAFKLAAEKYRKEGRRIPATFPILNGKMENGGAVVTSRLLSSWSRGNFLPAIYKKHLRQQVNLWKK